MFGLAVTGLVNIDNLKRNNTAMEGDWLFLTKPLGVGILSTAIKRGQIKPEHISVAISLMTQLNKAGGIAGATAGRYRHDRCYWLWRAGAFDRNGWGLA